MLSRRNAAAAIHPFAFLTTMTILLLAHVYVVDAIHMQPRPFLFIGENERWFRPLVRVGKLIAGKLRGLPPAKRMFALGQPKKRMRTYDTKCSKGLQMYAIDCKQENSNRSVSLCDLVIREDISGINDLYHQIGDDKFMQELLTPNHAQLTPLALAMARGDVATFSHLLSLGKSTRLQGRSFSML
jgi:hypothetical protein